MRYGSEHKAESRGRILKAAARQIRAKGTQRVGVAEVMAAAGLTHGAFYAHFDSKDELVAEAVATMFADANVRSGAFGDLEALPDDALPAALRAFIEGYLTPSHRDRAERGCPLPTLAAEVARSDARTRENFVAGMDLMTGRIQGSLARMGRPHPEADGRAVVARMVGALALARAMGPNAKSDELLRDCCEAIFRELGL